MQDDAARWQRIDELYAAAGELPADQRAAFLDGQCEGDADLRHELETLLAANENAGAFLTPQHLGKQIEEASAPLATPEGRSFGRYDVISRIGAGAMGEVYLARDRELGRRAAIKVLSNSLEGREAVSRFIQEAKAASGLNHPNILTVYEIGEAEGRNFIAAEFIEGSTLRERMQGGRIPTPEAFELAIQCAGALEAAHQAGIIHRDIKPENIMLRRDGIAKVVDFGLALLTQSYQGSILVQSIAGTVKGTPRYMSPEQARGEPLDARSDVFSLATVLYEMLTGVPRWQGDNVGEIFDSLLSVAPQAPSVFEPLPVEARAVLKKALDKDRDRRYQSMREFRHGLVEAGRQLSSVPPGVLSRRLLLGASAALVAVLAAARWYPRSPSLQILTPQPLTTDAGYEYEPRLSSDAARVVYTRNRRGDSPAVVIEEIGKASQRVLLQHAFSPAWSGSAAVVALREKAEESRRDVMLINLPDGSARKIAEVDTPRPFQDWLPSPYIDVSPDGRHLVASDGWGATGQCSLVLIALDTGVRQQLTTPDPGWPGDFSPRFSPDGKRIAFTRVQRMGSSSLHVLELTSDMRRAGASRRLPSPDLWNSFPAWTPSGRQLIYAAGEMRAARLKLVAAFGGSDPVSLPVQETAVTALDVRGHRIVYTRFPRNDDILRVPITGSDPAANGRDGVPLINSTMVDETPAYSPDGSQIAFLSNRTGSVQVWIVSADGSAPRQLTNTAASNFHHLSWTPDSKRLAFQAVMPGETGIYEISAEGSVPRLLVSGQAAAPAYSPDGQWLYFGSRRSGSPRVWRVPARGGDPEMVTDIEGDAVAFTPDGSTTVYLKGLQLFLKPSSGEASLLFRTIYSHQSFAVTNEAVYAIAESGGPWMLMAHSLRERRSRPVATYLRHVANGISVSPDNRFALLTQREQFVLDLMLLDGVDLSSF